MCCRSISLSLACGKSAEEIYEPEIYPSIRNEVYERKSALNHIFAFTNIPRPGIAHQLLKRILINALERTVEFHTVLFEACKIA